MSDVKVLVGAFNQEKVLVLGAFSVIVQLRRLIVCSTSKEIGESIPAVPRTNPRPAGPSVAAGASADLHTAACSAAVLQRAAGTRSHNNTNLYSLNIYSYL